MLGTWDTAKREAEVVSILEISHLVWEMTVNKDLEVCCGCKAGMQRATGTSERRTSAAGAGVRD